MTDDHSADVCRHDPLRFPERMERTPGAIIVCPNCQQSWRRPAWLNLLANEEIRSLQAMAEVLAVLIDYHFPDPDAAPGDLVNHRKAFQRITALTHTNHLVERDLGGILHRLEGHVN